MSRPVPMHPFCIEDASHTPTGVHAQYLHRRCIGPGAPTVQRDEVKRTGDGTAKNGRSLLYAGVVKQIFYFFLIDIIYYLNDNNTFFLINRLVIFNKTNRSGRILIHGVN